MIRRHWIVALAIVVSNACTGFARQAAIETEPAGAREAISAILRAHEEHWNRHDMDAWADAILHENADWVNWRGGYWHGKAAIKAGHEEIHRTFYRNSRLSPQQIEDLAFLTPQVAIAHVRSELGGDERAPGQVFPYRKTIIFTEQGGVWRIRALQNTRLDGVS